MDSKIIAGITIIACLTILWAGCWSLKKNEQNLVYQYLNKSVIPNIKAKVYHVAEDKSNIYLGIPADVLQFDSLGNGEVSVITYLYESLEGKKVMDTIYKRFSIQHTEEAGGLQTIKTGVPAINGKDYFVQFVILDENSKKQFKKELYLFRQHSPNGQDFLFTSSPDEDEQQTVLFENYIKADNKLFLHHRNYANASPRYFIKHYPPAKKLAPPPFINKSNKLTTEMEWDTTFVIEEHQLTFTERGLYLIKTTEDEKGGVGVLCVDQSFPKLTTSEDLVETLRYITQKHEYRQLVNSKDKKAAVDSFWLKRSGSFDRGRVLIREFYGRVQKANELFSTYKEGWKTDRGLLFIIYGQPEAVYRNAWSEQWMYKPQRNSTPLYFNFRRKQLPFTTQSYQLERSRNYEESWHDSVYEWRRGIIVNKSE